MPEKRTNDNPYQPGDGGMPVWAVQVSASAAPLSSEGKYAPLQVDSNGALKVAGSLTTTPVTNQTVNITKIGGETVATAGTGIISVGATNLDIRDLNQASDSVLVYGSDDGGTTKRVIKTDSGGAIAVDVESIAAGNNNIGDVDVASIAAGDNNIGNVDLASSIPAGTNNIGDVDIASIAAGDNNIGNVDIVSGTITTVTTVSTVSALSGGGVADDGTTPGNPVMVGGVAVETDGTDPTSVSAEDDVARFRTDRNRRLLVNTTHPNLWRVNENHSSAQTNNALKGAPGANLSLYVTDVIISNGATAGTVSIVEDTGGTPATLLGPYYLGINGGMSKKFATPIRITANKDVGFTSVTVTTHTVTLCGYTAP